MIFEPADAIAAGICVAARAINERGVTSAHPQRCAWCDHALDQLARRVEGFIAWAGWNEATQTYARSNVRAFAELPRDEQRRLVIEAQQLAEEVPAEDRSVNGH